MNSSDQEIINRLLSFPYLDAIAIDVDLADRSDPTSLCCVAIAYREGNAVRGYSFFINPVREINPADSHGVTSDDVKEAPRFKDFAKEALFPLMEKADHLIFHDAYRISHAIETGFGGAIPGAVLEKSIIDTRLLSRMYQPDLPDHSIDTVAKAMNIQHDDDSSVANAVAAMITAIYFQRDGLGHGPMTFRMSLDRPSFYGTCDGYEAFAHSQSSVTIQQTINIRQSAEIIPTQKPTEDEQVQRIANGIRSILGDVGWFLLYILAAIIGICLAT